jgi:hypothetical protein
MQILEQAEGKKLEGAIFEVTITPVIFESAEKKTQETL